jgi:glutaredoxin
VDLTVDVKEQETVLQATGMLAVPQLNINGHWVVGFDPVEITKYLN